MINKKEIQQEEVSNIDYQFRDWLDNVRLTGREIRGIEEIIDNLKKLIIASE